jgi:hypothetical protein
VLAAFSPLVGTIPGSGNCRRMSREIARSCQVEEKCIINGTAPVAQMDRAIASGAIGREFESLRAHQISIAYESRLWPRVQNVCN